MKNNCHNCRWLEYFEADYESSDQSGFFCNKREYKTNKQEDDHLNLLNNHGDRYRLAPKKCYETKESK